MTTLNAEQLAAALAAPDLPPVEQWHPRRCGEIDIRIARDGTWYHEGRPILREPLYRLFSTVLRRDDDQYYLVTPAEKLRIQVDDVPFLVVLLDVAGSGESQQLVFTTNCGDRFRCDGEHRLRIESNPRTGEPSPYVNVRSRLDGRLNRAVFYQLAELAETHGDELGVWSAGHYFRLGHI